MRFVRRALAALLAAASLLACLPARAQELIVPLTGQRSRPIEARTLFHTLFTDFFSEPDGTVYVQTGDIPAMWLRDSSAQTIPYVRFATFAPVLAARFNNVVQRDAKNIAVDPYANAFRANYRVWEEKWEIDSLAWPMVLAWTFWQTTHSRALFTPELHRALRTVVNTYRCEQLHDRCSRYRFAGAVRTHDTYRPDIGMLWSAFRPSDDAVLYRYNIPQQALAVVALEEIDELARVGYGDNGLAFEARSIASDIYGGVQRYGRVYVASRHAWIYAFETDGYGHSLFADDANVPNLTSLPYMGWCSQSDPTYLATRKLVLSSANPWYFKGRYAMGIGSAHTPPGFVWPLGIIARGLTATSAKETAEAITTLAETDSADGLIHESFYPDGYWKYTREEFGWANALYAELLFRSVGGFPAIPFAPGGSADPFQPVAQTPRLTGRPAQLRNDAMILRALSEMLGEADGHTVIQAERRTAAANHSRR
jgi:meiotically up-regulated gene 157 (Mug157) protein